MRLKDLKKDIKEKMTSTKHVAEKTKELGEKEVHGIKAESKDLKKLHDHKDLIYLKTDAVVIVLRKLGGLDEFLQLVDKLTKEGYWMMNSEDVKNLPGSFGLSLPTIPIGTLYYFQHKKYIN